MQRKARLCKRAASHAYILVTLDKLIRQPLHIPFISAPRSEDPCTKTAFFSLHLSWSSS